MTKTVDKSFWMKESQEAKHNGLKVLVKELRKQNLMTKTVDKSGSNT